jgi:hypothetical protein
MLSDKPKKIPLKDFIVKKIAVKMRINESTVDAVIVHQFKEVVKAMRTQSSVEISGFGTFIFLQNKAHYLVKAMENLVERKKRGEKVSITKDVALIEEDILYIHNKINHARESKADSGGVEEHTN